MIASAADNLPQPANRHAELVAAAGNIRVRRGLRLPVEQILLTLAAILFPLGLIFILLGWDGAAHNGHTYAQIDYLISGGLFGLGLSVAGGFMYFGYWLSRQLGESRRQSALTLEALRRVEELLDASLNSRVESNPWAPPTAAPLAVPSRSLAPASIRTAGGRAPADETAAATAATATTARANGAVGAGVADGATGRSRRARKATTPATDVTGEMPAVNGAVLYATPRGSLLHRASCPVVAKRTDLRAVPAGTEGYGYCTMCDAAGVPV